MIKVNAHKYGVSALCKVLNISRSIYYYEAKTKPDEIILTAAVADIFKISRNNYDTRKIIGFSAGTKKTAHLVKQAFRSVSGNLKHIQIFHTDRGNEFKNGLIDETLEAFEIKRSLSHKGCPYDNAVAEATFKIIKTEFVWNQRFYNLHQLQLQL